MRFQVFITIVVLSCLHGCSASESTSQAPQLVTTNTEVKPSIDGLIGDAEQLAIQGQTTRAMTAINEAIALAPGNARVYAIRGTLFRKSGDLQHAIEDLNTAINLDPDFAEAYCQRAFAHQQSRVKGSSDAAFVDANKAIELDDSLFLAFIIRGNSLRESGQFSKSLLDFARAIQLNPKSYSAYANRAGAYASLGDFTRAQADLDEAIALNPPQAELEPLLQFREAIRERLGVAP